MRKGKELLEYAAKELIQNHNTKVVEECFDKDYVAHAGNRSYRGHAFIKRYAKELNRALSKLKVINISVLAEDTHSITWQRTLTGTHVTDMRGIPASQQRIKWSEMVVSRFKDNRIVEEWVVSELMGQLLLKAGH